MKSPSPMSLFGNVIVPWTRSFHESAPRACGSGRRTACRGNSARHFVGRRLAHGGRSERPRARLRGFRCSSSSAACRNTGRLCPVEQALRVGTMALEVRALKHDVLVPCEAEPLESFEDGARAFIGAARLVRVFDAQQELSAVLLDEQPVEERGAGAADVEESGGGRGESEAVVHGGKLSASGSRLQTTKSPPRAGSCQSAGREGFEPSIQV